MMIMTILMVLNDNKNDDEYDRGVDADFNDGWKFGFYFLMVFPSFFQIA